MKLPEQRCYLLPIVISAVGLTLGQMSTGTVTPSLPLGPSLTTLAQIDNRSINASAGSGTTTSPPVTTVLLPSNCTGFNTSSCSLCLPGHFTNNASLNCSCCADGSCFALEDCLMCPQGYYQSLTGHMTCVPCSKGTYTKLLLECECKYLCVLCPRIVFTTRCSECTICPGGEEALSTAATECTSCQSGMCKPPKDVLCRMCQNGYYQIEPGQESCNLCPEQHYCPSPDVIPVRCPSDAFCPPGSTAPRYCMETFFLKSGDHCVLTPLTIFLLVIIAILILLLIIIFIIRRKKENMPRDPVRSPLLSKEQTPGQETRMSYGISWDSEPLYAGW
ncbi:laminin subunit gamma-2-like isoform X2 [Amblyraja radiata]|uniref:laminin subunit gamma-2-like isoform X2 n=1 Tax=Amblyraja radiata TaxID=386614 RepID=UPI001402E859|nr:laminin subunit gamma-2-like isoform X2 [Amblyraja radiata]